MGWIADRNQLKPKEKNPNPPTAHNFENSHVYTCQTLTSFPWKVGSFYNKSMHNVSALLGILIRHLRVKTTSLAVRLQIFFRLFLFIIGKGRSTIFKKQKQNTSHMWKLTDIYFFLRQLHTLAKSINEKTWWFWSAGFHPEYIGIC